jgi:multidrug efflux pump subunit AcrB
VTDVASDPTSTAIGLSLLLALTLTAVVMALVRKPSMITSALIREAARRGAAWAPTAKRITGGRGLALLPVLFAPGVMFWLAPCGSPLSRGTDQVCSLPA